MLQGKQPVIYGDGGQKRCFSFVQDCVNPLVKMGTMPNVVGETINIGPDEEYVSILELAELISDIMNFNLDPIMVPDRPKEVRYATCSADKARRLLDYRTTVTLREGLQSIIDWISAHGTKPFEYHLPIEIESPLVPETWTSRLI
jgi:UDP-glucose 4-epimerase